MADSQNDWWYNQQIRRQQNNLALGYSQNNYERSVANQQQGWDRQDLLRRYSDMRNRFAQSYVQRGMLNSGAYGHDLGQLLSDKRRDLGRQTTGAFLQNQGFDKTQQQLGLSSAWAQNDLAEQKRRARADIASQLTPTLRGG